MTRLKEKNQRFFSPSISPKSRKGDIPTLILVIGVFLVCAVAIFSFVFFNSFDRQSFTSSLESMAFVNSVAEQVRFYENIRLDPASFFEIDKGKGYYNITAEKKEGDERMFYVEYHIPLKTQSP